MKDQFKVSMVSAVVALIVAISSVWFLVPNEKTTPAPEQPVGAVSTLDGVDNPYISIGNRKSFQLTVPMVATSSMNCAVKNPFNATSTARFSFTVSTSSIPTSSYVALSTSTSQFGSATYGSSTNAWMHVTFPAFGGNNSGLPFTGTFMPNTATSTGGIFGGTGDSTLYFGLTASGTSAYIVKPNEWLTLRTGTTTAGTFLTYNQGSCSYEWIKE